MTHRPVFTAAVAFGCAFPLLTAAQTQRQPAPADRPRLDFVQSVGCAERENGSAATWWLTHAAEATVAKSGVFNPEQLEEAKTAALGANVFQLVGVADFLDVDGLLQSADRTLFTTAETANATGELREGRKVLVKGLLVDAGAQKRINLTVVVRLADTCG